MDPTRYRALKRAPMVTADREARVALAERLDALAQTRASHLPGSVLARAGWAGDQLAELLGRAHAEYGAITAQMVALQEELDWLTYQSYGLLPHDPDAPADWAPTAGEFDFADLAKRFPMSGGYIRNSAIRAAFLAAQEDTMMAQEHLERAIHLEYREMGKLSAGGRME